MPAEDDGEVDRHRTYCDECGNVTMATTADLANTVKCVDCQPSIPPL